MFGLRAVDYERVRVQTSYSGDRPNDARHRIAKRYMRVRQKLQAIEPWARRAIELRFSPKGWAQDGDLQKWWVPFGQWAHMIKELRIEGDTSTDRILRAKKILNKAIEAYMHA